MNFQRLLNLALDYAKQGWPVFPLHTAIGVNKCSCLTDCNNSIGKHPRTKRGYLDATRDPETICAWWEKWPDANIGLVTGSLSQKIVFDIDPRHGGDKSLRDFEAKYGELPKTLTALTGGGGKHLVYKYNPSNGNIKSRIGLLPGIDVKAEGGYIVSVGSRHVSGKSYKWSPGLSPEEIDPIEIPPSLSQLLFENKSTNSNSAEGAILAGKRNDTLFRLASSLRTKGLPEQVIKIALSAANQQQCIPPLSEKEVIRISQSANRYPDSSRHWPNGLSDEAFYGLAGRVVRAIEPHTESDPAALLIQFLVFAGNVVGRNLYFQVEGDRHFPNLYAVLVGRSSKARKGTSLGHIRRIFESIDEGWTKNRLTSGLSSGEGLIHNVRDKKEKLEQIKKGEKPQCVVVDEGVSDKRLLVVEGEYAQILKVIKREGNTLSPVVRNAWDTGTLSTLTKSNPERATEAHISIIGHITEDELRRHIDATESANGFGNRFLWACVERSKLLPDGGKIEEVDFGSITRELRNVHNFGSERKLRNFVRDEAAKSLWYDVYGELSEGKLGLTGAITSRAEAQVTRLALIYALLDCSLTITKEHLQAALEVWRYCEESCSYVFGNAVGNPISDKIIAALQGKPNGLTRTEIRDLFNRNGDKEQIERALNELTSQGLIFCQIDPHSENGGRSTERWHLASYDINDINDGSNLVTNTNSNSMEKH